MDHAIKQSAYQEHENEQRALLFFLHFIIAISVVTSLASLIAALNYRYGKGLLGAVSIALTTLLFLLARRRTLAGNLSRAVELTASGILLVCAYSVVHAPTSVIVATLGTLITAVLALAHLEGPRLVRIVITAWVAAGLFWLLATQSTSDPTSLFFSHIVVFGNSLLVYGATLLLLWQWRNRLKRQIIRAAEANVALREAHASLEAKVAERTAVLSQALIRYQIVSELTSDYTFSLRMHPDGRITTDWATDAMVRITGYRPEELDALGGLRAIVHPDDLTLAQQRAERVISGQTDVTNLRIIRRDGAVRWLCASARPAWDSVAQRVTQIYGAMEDITERRQIEERYRQLVELSPDAIMVHADGTIVFVNTAAVALFGASSTEGLVGRQLFDFIPPASHGFARRRIHQIIHEWVITPLGEMQICRVDGTTVEVETSGGPFMYFDRPAVQAVMRDITARKRAAEEQRGLDLKMRETQRLESLGVLAGGIAHDFNNLLLGMLGNASLARLDLPPQSPASESLAQIELAARRAADLTRQMLAYAGRGRFDVQPVALGELVQEMTQLVASSISKQITLQFELDPHLPAVEADATQMRQVVMNLIVNASEAIGQRPGTITVQTALVDADAAYLRDAFVASDLLPGSYVTLTVTDTGAGVDEATLARIFEPFFTTKATGRGLGLAAVLGIMRGHRGTLKVRSRVGEGTTFTLVLPALTTRVVAALPVAHSLETMWPAPHAATVLIVDDEPEVRDVAARMLGRVGYQVLCAADAATALAFVQKQAELHCVLLDVTLVERSGVQIIQELRALAPHLPVVLMSGYPEVEAMKELKDVGAEAFLQKPFSAAELQQTVVNMLRSAEIG